MPVGVALCSFEGSRRTGLSPFSGGYGEGETPLPIPNRAVKPLSADGTWPARAWESRSPPLFSCREMAPERAPSAGSDRSVRHRGAAALWFPICLDGRERHIDRECHIDDRLAVRARLHLPSETQACRSWSSSSAQTRRCSCCS